MSATIVALHGFLGRGSDWDAVRAAAGGNLRWICPDLFAPGGGDFASPPVVDEPAWLAGYSFGARLALRWLEDDPRRWRGALLVSANPGNFLSDAGREARRVSDTRWAEAFRRESWEPLMAEWNGQEVFGGAPMPSRAEADFDRAKLADALEKFSVAGQFTDPARLRGPLVWLAGERDRKFAGILDSMREAGFPGTFLPVAGAGHRLLQEAPEAVAAALGRLTS